MSGRCAGHTAGIQHLLSKRKFCSLFSSIKSGNGGRWPYHKDTEINMAVPIFGIFRGLAFDDVSSGQVSVPPVPVAILQPVNVSLDKLNKP